MNRLNFIKSTGIFAGLSLFGFKKPEPQVKRNQVIEFTPEILKKNNFGLYLINDKADVVKHPDYAATVSWKLGWNLGVATNNVGNEKIKVATWPKYGKINFLTDGWYCPIGNNYEEVCEYLNNNPHGEKFRILTKEELFYIINNRRNQKQLFYE